MTDEATSNLKRYCASCQREVFKTTRGVGRFPKYCPYCKPKAKRLYMAAKKYWWRQDRKTWIDKASPKP